jgi:uncharacterized protein
MKPILNCLIIALSFSLVCCGQHKPAAVVPPAEPVPVIDKKQYHFPEKPLGRTSDFENMFTSVQVQFLDSLLATHEEETTNQVAVVTFNPDTAEVKTGHDFDSLSLYYFNKWGVGTKEKNNGVGILIAPWLRTLRIEVGLGLENKLTDQEAKTIIDTIILPAFKNKRFFEGVVQGLEAIFAEIK